MYRTERNYENLNKGIFPGAGRYDIPILRPELTTAENWISFNYAKGCDEPSEHGVHFFVDDYQFNRIWAHPDNYLGMMARFDTVCTPDFSTYTDFPRIIQIYNHYRKHWLGAYWQAHGIKVIPTISWSTPDSFAWCFDGEPIGGAVAVSSVGTQASLESADLFMAGYNEMLRRLQPAQIIFYGKVPAPAAAVQNAPPSTAPQAMGGGSLLSGGQISYTPLNQKDEADLGKVWNGYDINTKLAINQYIRQDQTNTGYGVGQNLNHKLENGQALNANEQYMVNMMDAAMHPLGKNTTLIRAAHQDFLEALGVKNYQRMTDAQLNAAVQGVEYTEKKFVSTAYDAKKNPFIGGSQSGGREVFINISTPASTNCIMGNLKQAEIILSRDTKYRVKGAHFDGTFANPRVGGTLPRVIVDVEIYE